jgi:hypothetical protein
MHIYVRVLLYVFNSSVGKQRAVQAIPSSAGSEDVRMSTTRRRQCLRVDSAPLVSCLFGSESQLYFPRSYPLPSKNKNFPVLRPWKNCLQCVRLRRFGSGCRASQVWRRAWCFSRQYVVGTWRSHSIGWFLICLYTFFADSLSDNNASLQLPMLWTLS